MFTIAHTNIKGFFPIINPLAILMSYFVRNDEVCVVSSEGEVFRAYRSGVCWFNIEKED